jgi:hypothetical protein
MNAPARIPATRDRYIPQVRAFVPLCRGEDLQLRCSLLLIRDQATAGLRRCSGEAAPVLDTIERLATQYAFAKLPIAELKDLRLHLVRLTTCASGLDQFAYRLEHPEGAHEGG